MTKVKNLNVLYVKKNAVRRKIGKAHVKASSSRPEMDACTRAARQRTINPNVADHGQFDVVAAEYLGEYTETIETKVKRLFAEYRDDASPEVFNFTTETQAELFDTVVGGLIDDALRLLNMPARDWSVACQFEDPNHIADLIVSKFKDELVDPTVRVLLPFCGRCALKSACDRAGIHATNVLCVDHDRWFKPFADDIGSFLLRDLSDKTEWENLAREHGPFDLIIGNPPFTVGGDKNFYRTVLKDVAGALAPGGDVAWIAPAKIVWWLLTNAPSGLGVVTTSAEFKFENARADSKCIFLKKGVTTSAPLTQPAALDVRVYPQWQNVVEREAILRQPHFFAVQAPYKYVVSDAASNGSFAITGPDLAEARARLESEWVLETFLPSLNEEKDDRRLNMTLLRWLLNGR